MHAGLNTETEGTVKIILNGVLKEKFSMEAAMIKSSNFAFGKNLFFLLDSLYLLFQLPIFKDHLVFEVIYCSFKN